ncbi:hypothetical protein ZHAS_00008266 [Anopheles sinensis]|uniref:Uncharacterized protein n=1 Tax=Anopheles sinensis TaxID=74873 RepID=A0A084VRQ7_ANOSI|nr:hypothetical protein ZHAS_00008266 [Anopheles sinensis]
MAIRLTEALVPGRPLAEHFGVWVGVGLRKGRRPASSQHFSSDRGTEKGKPNGGHGPCDDRARANFHITELSQRGAKSGHHVCPAGG